MKQKFNFRFLLLFLVGIFASVSVMAQNIQIKGHVKDAAGEPIISATVIQKGTSNGCVTDFDGNFSLSAPRGALIQVSYVGYKTMEVKASTSMIIVLQEDSKLLDEAMVIGYAKVKKADATGAVTAIKPDELSKGITTSAQDMLVGKVAGVSVQTDGGTPGGGATIRIRGGSSLSASNDPLIVIDGLAMDNNGISGLSNVFAMVNPNDIETFTVLKDASATAIYGSRASNGVIIITTKKGGKNKMPKLSYNGNVSFGTPRKTLDMMDGNEYRKYVTDLYGGLDNLPAPLGDANTDWQDEIYRTAVSHDHNVSASGSVGNLPYRVSLGYTDQQGILKNSDFSRFTASINLSPTFFDDHLRVNLNAKYMNAKRREADTGAVGAALAMDPTRPVHDSSADAAFNGGYWQYMMNASYNDPNWTRIRNTNAPANPVSMLELVNKKGTSNVFVGNVEFDYKFHCLPELHLHANIGGDYSEGIQNIYESPYYTSYYGYTGIDQGYKYNLSGNIYAQYIKEIGINNIDVMVGAEQQHFHRNGYQQGGGHDWYDENHNKLDVPTLYQPTTREASAFAYRNSLVSYFGRLNYILADRYLLTYTMRWDGSSRFSKDNRWGVFPSLALGWKINEESFLKDVSALSELKLRLGWGITGQQDLNDLDNYYRPMQVVGDDRVQYPFGDKYYNTSRPSAYNADLKWEKTTTWNVGLDYGFLDNRIDGSLDFYVRNTDDLLSYVKAAAGTNFQSSVWQNIGSLRNTGLEFTINARPVVTKDFTWQVSYNVTWNKNEITDLNGDAGYVEAGETISSGGNVNHVMVNMIGQPANSFYVYQQVYDEKGKPITNAFVDRNGDGKIDVNDKYIYKKPTADVLMGFTSKFLYKNWDFSFSLRASLNNYLYYNYDSDKADCSTAGIFSNNAYQNRAHSVIDAGMTTRGDFWCSDYFIRNASFLRCDNITLGYSFNRLFSTPGFKGLDGRIYATVQNPFVITKYEGLDPEVNNSGVDKNPYPRPTTYLLGLSLQF